MPQYETDLRERALAFATACYRLHREVWRRFPALRNAGNQLFEAASSIGANLSENEGFNSRKELAARYAIAYRESRESRYWLRLIAACEPDLEPGTRPLQAECKELIAMTAAALKKLRLPNP